MQEYCSHMARGMQHVQLCSVMSVRGSILSDNRQCATISRPLGVNPGASRCSSHEEIPRCGYCRSVSLRSSFSTRRNISPALRRLGRSPSGYSSANAGSDGSSRKFWIGFKSASRAEISHYMAPDEGVLGRGGDAPPHFSVRQRKANAYGGIARLPRRTDF